MKKIFTLFICLLDRINSSEELMNVDVANGIFTKDFELLDFQRSENVKHYESVKCI